MNILSQYIRLVRNDLKLSQEDLATRLSALSGKVWKHSRVSTIERGVTAPTATTMELFAQAFGLKPNAFFIRAAELWRKDNEEIEQ